MKINYEKAACADAGLPSPSHPTIERSSKPRGIGFQPMIERSSMPGARPRKTLRTIWRNH
jgi:hypothetical protein